MCWGEAENTPSPSLHDCTQPPLMLHEREITAPKFDIVDITEKINF